METVYSFTGRF